MRKTYQILAWIIAACVVVQAGSMALGVGSVLHHVAEGGVVDKVLLDNPDPSMAGSVGFVIHSVVGSFVIHGLALLLLVLAFFAKVHHGVRWAAVLFVLVFVQGSLGYMIRDLPYAGALHGANALTVLVVSVVCARLARESRVASTLSPALEDVRG